MGRIQEKIQQEILQEVLGSGTWTIPFSWGVYGVRTLSPQWCQRSCGVPSQYIIVISCLFVVIIQPYGALRSSCLLLSEVSLRFHCSTSCFTYLPHRRVGATLFTRNNHIQCINSWIPDPGGYGCRPQNAKCISRCTVSPRKKKFLQANGVCHVDRLYSFIGSNSRTNLA